MRANLAAGALLSGRESRCAARRRRRRRAVPPLPRTAAVGSKQRMGKAAPAARPLSRSLSPLAVAPHNKPPNKRAPQFVSEGEAERTSPPAAPPTSQ